MTEILLILFGTIVGWFVNKLAVATSERLNMISEHIRDVEKFVVESRDYWMTDFSDQLEEGSSAIKILAFHAATSHFYGQVDEVIYGIKTVKSYRDLSLNLFSIATGGDFETKNHKADTGRAIQVYDAGWELIHFLRMSRRKQIYPRFLHFR